MPIHSSPHGWILETRNTAYALGLNQAGLLTHRYWGACLPFVADYPAPADPAYWAADDASHLTPEEFPGYGGFTSGAPFTEMVQGEYSCKNVNVANQIKSPDSLLRTIQKMIALRKGHPAFGSSNMEWIETGNPAVAAYLRQHDGESILVFNNLAAVNQVVQLPAAYQKMARDLSQTNHFHSKNVWNFSLIPIGGSNCRNLK